MTGSPNNTVSRLDEFLAAAKGETASLVAQKAKSKPLHPFSIRLTQEERERLELEAKGKPLSVYMRERPWGMGQRPGSSGASLPPIRRGWRRCWGC